MQSRSRCSVVKLAFLRLRNFRAPDVSRLFLGPHVDALQVKGEVGEIKIDTYTSVPSRFVYNPAVQTVVGGLNDDVLC